MSNLRLGDTELCRIGLGTNRITDTDEARRVLEHAVERGVNFIDTAHLYTGGESERVIGATLAPYPDGLVVASKGGYSGASPQVLREELEQSLKSLRTDCITLYQLHRVDPAVDIEVSVGALKSFQDEVKIQHIGLSAVTVEQIKAAQSVAKIASVQNEYNLSERGSDDVINYCEQQGIIFIPYFPLGGRKDDGAMLARVEALASKYGVSTRQLTLAWLLKRSPVMLPIPGTLSMQHLDDNLAALDIELSTADFAAVSS